MKYQIRDHQERDLGSIRRKLAQLTGREGVKKAVMYVLATGGGKTVTSGFMIDGAKKKEKVIWFLCHRKELAEQASDTFRDMGIEHGLIMAGQTTNMFATTFVGMVQTVSRRLSKLDEPDIIIFDEAHHISAGQWDKIYNAFPNAYKVGVTATPVRTDGKGLDMYFEEMIMGKNTKQLIDEGWLAPFKLFAPSTVDTSEVHTRAGDFKKEELEQLLDKSSIIGDIVSHYMSIAGGKKAIVFAATIKHSQHIVAMFKAAGIRAEHIDGSTDKSERAKKIQAYKDGHIDILSNVDLFGEGFDVPATEVVIMARPTQSLGLYLQQAGRALRPVYKDGMPKDTPEERHAAMAAGTKPHAIILDHAGNVFRHGLPDEERDWTLKGKKKKGRKKEESTVAVKSCPKCFNTVRSATRECECGYVWEVSSAKREHVDGQLEEITEEQAKKIKRKEQGRAATLADLIELGKERGYKNPIAWANHVHRGRKRK